MLGIFSSVSCFATNTLCDLAEPFGLYEPQFFHLYQEKGLGRIISAVKKF